MEKRLVYCDNCRNEITEQRHIVTFQAEYTMQAGERRDLCQRCRDRILGDLTEPLVLKNGD